MLIISIKCGARGEAQWKVVGAAAPKKKVVTPKIWPYKHPQPKILHPHRFGSTAIVLSPPPLYSSYATRRRSNMTSDGDGSRYLPTE